jgi:hypothetical protein
MRHPCWSGHADARCSRANTCLFPLYDAGNFGMQRRRVHGVMADPSFNPRALMDDEPVEFTKAMETIDTIQGPQHETPQMATVG